jgi:trigger factor
LNVQTEKLDNHVARLTVEVETSQLEKAKKQAARKLAKRVNIPGFRKGKAPYRVLVSYVGEAPIVEEAIETLGNDVFRKALDESEIEPYTIGELEDFQLDPQPTFVFTVPMQPTVELNDYLSVRVDYEVPEVTDEDVDEALRRLQEEHAVVEESQSEAALGDKVTADVTGEYIEDDDVDDSDDEDDEPSESDDEAHAHDEDDDHEHGDEDDHDHEHNHDAPIHQHGAVLYLDEDREPLPGFAEQLVGANVGDTVQFDLTYPDDSEKYGDFAGRGVRFQVDVSKIENVTLPPLNDDFAAKVADEDPDIEEETLTLLELRARVRENISKAVADNYDNEYMSLVMEKLVEIGDFAYPDAMVVNQIDGMIESTAQRFGLAVEDYLRLSQNERDDLYEDETYREAAVSYIQRSLVMRGILDEENLEVEADEIAAEIDRFVAQFGEQADAYRGLFDTPEMRDTMTNNILEQKIRDRIVAIGRGESVATSSASNDAEAGDEVATDDTAATDSDDETSETDE